MLRNAQKIFLILLLFIIPVSFCLASDFPAYSIHSVEQILPDLPVPAKNQTVAIGLLQSSPNYDFKQMRKIDSELRRYAAVIRRKGGLNGKRVNVFTWINTTNTTPVIYAMKQIETLKKLKGSLIVIDKEIAKNREIKEMLTGIKVFIY